MNTLILPGFSSHNLSWAEDCAKYFKPEIDSIIHPWTHWTGSNHDMSKFNPEAEFQSKFWNSKEIDFILAKSIGTYFVAWLLLNKFINPEKIILCGIPIDISDQPRSSVYKSLIPYSSDLTIFHNENDHVNPSSQLMLLLKNINLDIKPIIKPGDSHDYPYYEEFKNIILN